MKRIFLLTIAMFISTYLSAQIKWYSTSSSTLSGSLNSIYFISDNEGWAVGSLGTIYHTKDGAASWESQYSGSTGTFARVFFLDKNNGWIASDAATYLRTNDGGKNWTATKLRIMDTTNKINQILFFDLNTGVLLATNRTGTVSYLYRTTDGGTTWTNKTPTAMTLIAYEMYFLNNTFGVVSGKDWSSNFYTTDGGETWTKQQPINTTGLPGTINYTRTDIRSIFMVNTNVGYATGWGTSAVAGQPTIYLKTTDGGKNWNYLVQKQENLTYDYNNKIYFTDENTGYAFGGNSTFFGGWVCKTTNGGVDWIKQPLSFSIEVVDVAIKGNTIYFLGANANIMKSTDMGVTANYLTRAGGAFSTVCFPSANVGYAGGNTNPLYIKTTDGGKSWKTKNLMFEKSQIGASTRTISQFYFLDENYGYCANKYRLVTKTTDGGETWKAMTKDTTTSTNFHFNSIYFVDKNTGWVVGRNGGVTPYWNYTIQKTTDGGATWSIKTGANELNSIHFSNATTGIAVGKKASILYTTDGGTNWTAAVVPAVKDSVFSDVKFAAPNSPIAFVVGGSGTLLITTDAGKSWLPHPESPVKYANYNFNQIAVKDLTTALISGYIKTSIKGCIIGTANGGLVLTDFTDTTVLDNNLTTITCDPSGTFWATGPGSVIYSTKNTVGIQDGQFVPSGYALSQNYPNPFNPSTTIAWKMPKGGNVKITIYDLLGKEVQAFSNTYPEGGKYSFTWDGRNSKGSVISSGVYYYKIEADKFSDVKKMMFIR